MNNSEYPSKFDSSNLSESDKKILENFYQRRKLFDEYLRKEKVNLFTCPGCGYPTLTERGGYEICDVCNWEDDSQDDPKADEIWGGPNSDLSLTENRIMIGRTLKELSDSLRKEINLNPDEVIKRIGNHQKVMEEFNENEKLMTANHDDPIWKEWKNKQQGILNKLMK